MAGGFRPRRVVGLAVGVFGGEVAERARGEVQIEFGAAGDEFGQIHAAEFGEAHAEIAQAECLAAGAVEFGDPPVAGAGEVVEAGEGAGALAVVGHDGRRGDDLGGGVVEDVEHPLPFLAAEDVVDRASLADVDEAAEFAGDLEGLCFH